jgi:TolB-like protein
MITIAVLAAAAFLLILFKPFSPDNRSEDTVIAVLPFRNDSPDRTKDYVINGLMEEILNRLSMVDGLSVHSRTTSETYRDSDKSIRQIGKELGADYILDGSATLLDNLARIRIQLIEPATDRDLWSEPYEREISLDNLFEVQENVAGRHMTRIQQVITIDCFILQCGPATTGRRSGMRKD